MLSSTTVRAAAVALVLAGTALLGSGCTAVAGLQRDATQFVQQHKLVPQGSGSGGGSGGNKQCPPGYIYYDGLGCCNPSGACV